MIRRRSMRLLDGTQVVTWSLGGRLQITTSGWETMCALAVGGGVLGLCVGRPEWPRLQRDHRRLRLAFGPVAVSAWRGNVSGPLDHLLGLVLPPAVIGLQVGPRRRRLLRRLRRAHEVM